jgi:hypothetical protein
MRAKYHIALDQMKAERQKVRNALKQAEEASDRGYEVEKLLEKLNDSAAGVFLNIGGQRLSYMLLDMSLYVRPALSARVNASRDLVRRYDEVVNKMEGILDRYRAFDRWAAFYSWQDWARLNLAHSESIRPTADLDDARQTLDSAIQLADQLAQKRTDSRGASAIDGLVRETIVTTSATQEQAQKLIAEANKRDAKAASSREFSALLQLAVAIAGATRKQPAAKNAQVQRPTPVPPPQPPVIIYQNFEFRMVPQSTSTSRIP